MNGLCAPLRRQRGVVLLLSLIMLMLVMMMITTAYTLSIVSLHAVRNIQVRAEALAAADIAIEAQISAPFTDMPAAVDDLPIDIDQDGIDDYQVDIARPVCVRATPADLDSVSSVTLSGIATSSAWQTVWELAATVTDPRSGVSLMVRQGVRVLLAQERKDAVCA